ncbi:VOC family protein [Leptospira sp. 96542]|nr:VOC family protein [Leptospira sp. 96542]
MIHHIAIGSPSPKDLAKFYESIPGLRKIQEHRTETGDLRSVWFESGKSILMLELGKSQGPKALIFDWNLNEKQEWAVFFANIPIFERTKFTIYFLDPEGNKLGVSHYPNPLTEI